MAILINKQLTILGELSVNSIYLRISYNVDKNGILIRVNQTPYLSKNSYKNNPDNNKLYIQGLPNSYKITYNREINGNDLLKYIHDSFIEKLTTDQIVDNIQITEKGEQILVPHLVSSKFADISEVSIVDI